MKIAMIGTRTVLAPVAVAVVTFLVALLVWMLTHSAPGVAAALARGSEPRAPTFSISALRGTDPINLERYGGRVIVVNFWASWCGPCRAETPTLIRAWQHWRSHLVTFIGVDTRDSASDARAFLGREHIPYTIGRDGSGRATRAYGLRALPATFIISPGGHVVASFLGAVSEGDLDATI